MKRLFVESRIFTMRVMDLVDAETYRKIQNELLETPDKGKVIPGCSGLRKLRAEAPSRGKGKRGGCRIVYLNIPDAERLDLIAIL